MKIFSIPDAERFIRLIEKSRGDVILHLPDRSRVELKQNHTAQQFFQIMNPGLSGLDIHLSNSKDTLDFMQYMREAGVNH